MLMVFCEAFAMGMELMYCLFCIGCFIQKEILKKGLTLMALCEVLYDAKEIDVLVVLKTIFFLQEKIL